MNRNKLSLRVGWTPTAIVFAAIAALTLASPAVAARPTREVIDIGTPELEALISADLTALCGFEIAVIADQTVTVMVFSRNDGTFHREIDQWQLHWTVTNVETGASIAVHSVGPEMLWMNRDGVPMHAFVGLALIGYTGRELSNADTGELLRASGHFVGDIEQVFCDALLP
jgi:hypothetical protein